MPPDPTPDLAAPVDRITAAARDLEHLTSWPAAAAASHLLAATADLVEAARESACLDQAAALAVHGRFLADKYAPSSLDLEETAMPYDLPEWAQLQSGQRGRANPNVIRLPRRRRPVLSAVAAVLAVAGITVAGLVLTREPTASPVHLAPRPLTTASPVTDDGASPTFPTQTLTLTETQTPTPLGPVADALSRLASAAGTR